MPHDSFCAGLDSTVGGIPRSRSRDHQREQYVSERNLAATLDALTR